MKCPSERCPTCNTVTKTEIKCDECGKVAAQMPIELADYSADGFEATHFCSLVCMRKYAPSVSNEWWRSTRITLDPKIAMRFAEAVEGGEVKP